MMSGRWHSKRWLARLSISLGLFASLAEGQIRQSPVPSDMPSDMPSDVPSMLPSDMPSQVPSTVPSVAPSKTASEMPSLLASSEPSVIPTMYPSETPSSSPTPECHDIASYRSPINNFTCEVHENTNCIQWRYLGLTIEELEELLKSCPVSCGIECGTVDRLTLLTTFQMYNMSTFLGPESVKTMEEAADEYLTEYVRVLEPQSRFLLSGAELSSQRIVVRRQYGRYLRIPFRSLQETRSIVLSASWRFPYLAIGLEFVDVNQYLREGLESKGFILALQKSGDAAFKNAYIDYDLHNGTTPSSSTQNNNDDDDGPSPGVLAASVLLILMAGGIGTLVLIFYKRDSRSMRFWKRQEVPVLSSPVESYRSVPSNTFSFESANNVVTNMVQRMASLSPRSGSTSTDEISDDEGGNDSKRAPLSTRDSKKELISEVESVPTKEDEEQQQQQQQQHPLAGIIPPMIVIDNIDADDAQRRQHRESPPEITGTKTVVPSMRIEATDDFVAALNDRSKPFDPSAFSGVLASSPVIAVDDPDGLMQSLRRKPSDRLSSFRVRSSTDEEDDSSDSKQIDTIEEEQVLLDLRRAVSEGATIEAVGSTTDSPNTGEVPPTKRGFLSFAVKRPSRASSPSRSVNSSPARSIRNSSPTRALSDPANVKRGYHSDDELPPTDKKRRARNLSFFARNKSPLNHRTSPPTSETVPSAERRPSTERPPRWMLHTRSNSRCSSAGSEGHPAEEDRVLRVFQVPRKGKFGLVIETSSLGGPNVLQVKDYSPLLGLVLPGDQIVDIGGVPTKGMSQKEIIKLLSGKGSHWGSSSAIHLTVSRKIDKEKSDAFDFAGIMASSDNLSVDQGSQNGNFPPSQQAADPPSSYYL